MSANSPARAGVNTSKWLPSKAVTVDERMVPATARVALGATMLSWLQITNSVEQPISAARAAGANDAMPTRLRVGVQFGSVPPSSRRSRPESASGPVRTATLPGAPHTSIITGGAPASAAARSALATSNSRPSSSSVRAVGTDKADDVGECADLRMIGRERQRDSAAERERENGHEAIDISCGSQEGEGCRSVRHQPLRVDELSWLAFAVSDVSRVVRQDRKARRRQGVDVWSESHCPIAREPVNDQHTGVGPSAGRQCQSCRASRIA